MKLKISFKNLKHTVSIDERIQDKTERLEKYFQGNTEVQWTCSTADSVHIAEVKIMGPSFTYHATGKSENLYKSIDKVINKIESQLRKRKDKLRNKVHNTKGTNVLAFKPAHEYTIEDYNDDAFEDYKKVA